MVRCYDLIPFNVVIMVAKVKGLTTRLFAHQQPTRLSNTRIGR